MIPARATSDGATDERSLSVVLVLPYGERRDGFFPDTLLAELGALARSAGHRARLVRVYYEGDDASADREIAERLRRYLALHEADVVVLERVFDPRPIEAHVANHGARAILVTRGDSFDPATGIELVIGAEPGVTRAGTTRRSPTIGELKYAFQRALSAIASGRDPSAVPGVSKLVLGELVAGAPLERPPPSAADALYDAIVEQDVIAFGDAPLVIRKTIFGNVGCPFADDPLSTAHFAGVRLPIAVPMARLGCAFCSMGGDYEKRPDAEVVASSIAQAAFWTEQLPDIQELVLSDQHALRYLATLVREAARHGVRPVRWLFAARADAFVRERSKIEDAIAEASRTGNVIEVYLSGFEALSDTELARYNKGCTRSDQLAAIAAMRELAARHPTAFSYAAAKGHSLILWNPWTSPDDLAESLDAIRRTGARELFHELGRNRLRLYRDLPITYAAERDGALSDHWHDGDEGAGRRKGYNVELPWRFLDGRTERAYLLARALRERFGAETELAQLRSVVEHVRDSASPDLDGITTLERLADAFLSLSRDPCERDAELPRPRRIDSVRAEVVLSAGACNNACPSCSNADAWLDDGTKALAARIIDARATGRSIVLAGREPTMHPDLFGALTRAHGEDRRWIGMVTNARRFTVARFAEAAHRSGLGAASVKLFAPDDANADAISRAPGAHQQALAGVRALVAASVLTEVRVPLDRLNVARLPEYADLARGLGAPRLRLECSFDALGLRNASQALDATWALAERCVALDVALDAVPIGAGYRGAERIPAMPVTRS